MKRTIIFFLDMLMCFGLFAQLPESFSWADRHHLGPNDSYNYITTIKDQGDNGPCNIFASVAAVEAMSLIYFNRESANLDLAESHIYNHDCGLCGTNAFNALNFIKNNGIVDEDCFKYSGNCDADCDTMCQYPAQLVTIPGFSSDTISSISALKQLIMDKGPLVANIQYGAYVLHGESQVDHAVLLIGWRYNNQNLEWHIKDSWPSSNEGTYLFDYVNFNILKYCTIYFYVKPIDNGLIECEGLDCTLFSRATPVDRDEDGFYHWGWDFASKPNGASYPNKMDFDDGDAEIIFRSGDTIYATPTVSGPTTVCKDGEGDSPFELDYVPPGFTCTWYISKNAFCFNTYQGNGSSVDLYPNSSCIGKESEITFRITQDGDGGYAEYKKSFYVNCPREDLTSYSVLDSYGGSPPKYGDTYYLCPYTTYNIFYNEYDSNCDVTITDWDLPYGWTEHFHEYHYISIYTNDWPDGFLYVKGTTECNGTDCNESEVTLMSIYFGAAECGGYFLAYPNPSESFVDIDVDKVKLRTENISIDGECILTLIDKSGMIKFKTEFQGFPYRIDTSGLPEGLYFINIIHKGKTSTIRLIIQHP
jgi:hypothetical protein